MRLVLMAAGMAVLGALLIFLSIQLSPSDEEAAAAKPPGTATAPASGPAPLSDPADRRPIDPNTAINRNMSGMLLLFGLVSFTVTGVCIILVILDIRRSRPAWQTQTRYPRRR